MFKNAVRVYCADTHELSNLLEWLRQESGLNYVQVCEWTVEAIIPSIFSEESSILGFYVYVPYALAKPLFKEYEKQQAFEHILKPVAQTKD